MCTRTLLVSLFFRISRPIGRGSLLATAVAVLVPLLVAVDSASATPDVFRVEDQFDNIAQHGDPLAVRRGVGKGDFGPSGAPCKHYQGLARGAAADGTPYFFLTRSRNRSAGCPLYETERPGELLIARLGSRDKDGERLRSNRLAKGKKIDDTGPPPEDKANVAIYFDGNTWPLYWHPGGVQLVDDVLVVPLTCKCAKVPVIGTTVPGCPPADYTCPNESGVVLIDVSEPEVPVLLRHQVLDELDETFGAVAVAKSDIVCEGTYLFAFADTDARNLHFACSDTDDLRTTENIIFRKATAPNPTPRHWQTVNFVRDTDGMLYLLGADKSRDSLTSGRNWITKTILLEQRLVPDPDTSVDAILPVGEERRLSMKWPFKNDVADLGDLKAASGFYVSPTGQLIFYSANHGITAAGNNQVIEMGEFRSMNVSYTNNCGLQLPPDLGGPYVVDEGESVSLDFNVHYIEPWLHLFSVVNFYDPGHPVRSLMLDWADQDKDDHFADFRKVGGSFSTQTGFNNTAASLTFCGPAEATFSVYKDINFSTADTYYTSVGDNYKVTWVSDIKDVKGDLRNKVSSAKIDWVKPVSNQIVVDWDWPENETEPFIIPYGERSFSIERTYLDDEPSGTPQDEQVIIAYDAEVWPNLDIGHILGKRAGATVTVRNVAPVIESLSITDSAGLELGIDVLTAPTGGQIRLEALFTDPGIPDTQTATINWGDGTVEPSTSFDQFSDANGGFTGRVQHSHIYTNAGIYDVVFAVEDDDGGQSLSARQIEIVAARGGGGGGLCSLGPTTASAWQAGDLWLLLAFITSMGLWRMHRRQDAVT